MHQDRLTVAAQAPRFMLSRVASATHIALWMGVATGTVALWPAWAHAQPAGIRAEQPRRIHVPAGTLGQALNAFAVQAGVELSADAALLQGRRSAGLDGAYTAEAGFAALLEGAGLEAVRDADGSYTLRKAPGAVPAAAAEDQRSAALPAVTVVGRNAGASDLPQAYAGGQVARGAQLGFLGNADFLDTPFATQAYTSRYMQDRGAQRLSDVIGLADPSVEFDRTNGYAEQISVRGFASAAQDITYGGLYGVLPSMRIYPELAERIELIKGPAALLNGMMPDDSVGGTVNIVPKRAGAEPNAQVTATYASHAHGGAHVDVGQRFGEGRLGVRFNGMYRDGESEISGQDKRVGLGTLGLDWLGEGVRLSADLITSRERARGFGYWGFYGDLMEGGVPETPDPGHFMNSPESFYLNQDHSGVVRAEVDVGRDWLAYAALGARSSRFESLANHIDIIDMRGNTADGWYYWKTKASTSSGLAGVRGKFATGGVRHELNVNVTAYRNKSDDASAAFFDNPYASNIYRLDYSPAPDVSATKSGPYIPWLRETLRSVGVADTLAFADGRFKLTVGVRRQWVESEDLQWEETYKSDALSPSLAAVWSLTPATSLYANYSTGLSTGGTAPIDAANAGQVLAPIRTRQHEIGVKHDFGDWALTASLFQIRKPTADYHPQTNVWGVVGDTRNRGLEILAQGEPVRGWRVLGGVAFNGASYEGEGAGENAGKDVVGIPRHMLKLATEFDLSAVKGLTLTAGLMHSGKQALRASNNAYAPAWTRVDAGVRYATRWQGRPLTLRAEIQNLGNQAYWLAPAFNGLGAPRTLLMSATVDF